MKPFFSILVPIYNVEIYLAQCLDSLVNQSFKDVQIICINDGSLDSCPQILNCYSQKDSRICLVNQENKGYGAALNHGMQYVQADYVSIVEPDDFLSLNTYDSFYTEIKRYPQADIIKYAYWNYNIQSREEMISPSSSAQLSLPDKPFKITRYPQLLCYHPSIWSCVYRTSFLQENNLRFVEAPGAGWTDNPFFISSMCLAKNILWRNHKFYYYRQGHATSSSNLKDCRIPVLRLIDILDFLEDYNIMDFGVISYIYKRAFNYINIVCNNKYYKKNEIEPLIRKVLLRLDANVVNTDFFCLQEKSILLECAKE